MRKEVGSAVIRIQLGEGLTVCMTDLGKTEWIDQISNICDANCYL